MEFAFFGILGIIMVRDLSYIYQINEYRIQK